MSTDRIAEAVEKLRLTEEQAANAIGEGYMRSGQRREVMGTYICDAQFERMKPLLADALRALEVTEESERLYEKAVLTDLHKDALAHNEVWEKARALRRTVLARALEAKAP